MSEQAYRLALLNATEQGAALLRRRRIYAARSEVQDMFPDDVIEVMTDAEGHITFERQTNLNRA